jgi:hypothetical protein
MTASPAPLWLPHLRKIRAAHPTAHPSTLANLLMAHHGVDTTGAHVKRLLEQFCTGNNHQQEAA